MTEIYQESVLSTRFSSLLILISMHAALLTHALTDDLVLCSEAILRRALGPLTSEISYRLTDKNEPLAQHFLGEWSGL